MDTTELCYLSIAELSALLRARKVSAVEVVEAYLRRIEATEPAIGSYVTVTAELAMTRAKQVEAQIAAGRWRGPLHGISVALKDLYFTKGIRTTGGSRVLERFVPDEDAAVWERLRDAGAVLVGKTHMHEFAYGPSGENPHFGTPRNPWDASRIPGGSSSGSGTAVATGQAAMAMGTDTGGSIRIPAALCGVVGLKPTYGRVSRRGVIALGWSFDHCGPLTRTVEDAALVLGVMAGHDPRDPTSSTRLVPDYTATLRDGVKGLRVGLARPLMWGPADPEVERLARAAVDTLVKLGATVREIKIPLFEHLPLVSRTLVLAEALAYHAPLLRKHGDLYDPQVRIRLEAGAVVSAQDLLQASRVRALVNREIARVFEEVDLLASPTVLIPAPPLGAATVRAGDVEVNAREALLNACRPFNVSGLPAISVPCGFTKDGLPVGLQLGGRAFDEATVLRAAYAYEQATEWHKRRPPEPGKKPEKAKKGKGKR